MGSVSVASLFGKLFAPHQRQTPSRCNSTTQRIDPIDNTGSVSACGGAVNATAGAVRHAHTGRQGGVYDGGRHTEYYQAWAHFSGPLRVVQPIRRGPIAVAVPR